MNKLFHLAYVLLHVPFLMLALLGVMGMVPADLSHFWLALTTFLCVSFLINVVQFSWGKP